jgi:two-component system chemotaxis response regulator CheY
MASFVIVDDSAGFRRLAARLLRDQGHEVAGEASTRQEAVALARGLAPDALLVDVHLGADDGWQVARAVRALERAPRVVMVSSDPGAGDPALVAGSGAEAFVAKEALAATDLGALLAAVAAR